MNARTCLSIATAFAVAFSATAQEAAKANPTTPAEELEEEEEREYFEEWHVAVGLAFNTRIRSNIRMVNLPMPGGYHTPSSSSKAAALSRALARRYDDGGFIGEDSLDNGFDTENWKLTEASYHGNGFFTPENAYREVVGTKDGRSYCNHSDDRYQFGLSIDLSRELWVHGEEEEKDEEERREELRRRRENGEEEEEEEEDKHRWGIDLAAAASYFFARDIYDGCAGVSRTDVVRKGVYRTDVNDPDATFDYDQGWDSADADGMYGRGNARRTFVDPALGYAGIGDPYNVPGSSTKKVSSRRYHADGDYRELELLLMLRPWYELKDWWRLYAQVGLGLSWGSFETCFRGNGIHWDEDFRQWDLYLAAGAGTVFRYERLDLGVDVVGRFFRDDLEVNGKYLSGSIERADWMLRVMVGIEL